MISRSVWLACSTETAFDLWTQQISEWWPQERRHTGDSRSSIHLLASGRFFERSRDGREVELGAIVTWRRGERLEFEFYPGTDVDHPTHVTVIFVAEASGTRVTVEHGPTETSRDLWDQRCSRFEGSWAMVLAALENAATR